MNPATITQNNMTQEAIDEMFKLWEQHAPKNPLRVDAWFSSLYQEYDTATGIWCIKSMIEEYNEDGGIELVGLAQLEFDTKKYTEKYD